jgi:polysaccharide biosynthesis protein PslE
MADEDLIRARTQPPAPTLRELAMVLFRQRKVFVSAFGAVMAAAVLYVFAGPRYQANMKILVRPGRADAPVSAQENAPLDLTRLAITEEELNSEVELLHDDEVLRKVVVENGLAGRDWLHFVRFGEHQEERIERAARQLDKKLKVEPVKKTNLIEIRYASEDATRAANVLRSLANAYLEKHTVVHRPNGEVHFFELQTEDSRRQLEEAQGRLMQFTSVHRVIEAAQERDLALTKLSDLDAGYRQTQIDLSETGQRISELQEKLKSLPERTTTQIRTADNPELLKALKSSLLDLQLKRTQLLTKFEPNHRLVQEVDQQIAQAQAAITAENTAPVRDETTDKSNQYEWAKSELEKAQVQLKGLQARAAATGAQESAYRALARQLGEDAITQDDLQNTEKAAEDNYLLYLKKREDARMADALDQRGIVNVAIAEQPAAPALPLWSTWAIVVVGMAVAGTAGAGAAFAADHLDPAFRSPEDAIEYLNAPVLASLPINRRERLLT